LACPVDFSKRPEQYSKSEKLKQNLENELGTMKTWFEMGSRKEGLSATCLSGLEINEIVVLYHDFIENRIEENVIGGQKISDILRLAAEDLKEFYFKAVSVQPGQSTDPGVLSDWFWGETFAAALINEVRKKCLGREEKDMRLAGKLLLIPRNQLYRFK